VEPFQLAAQEVPLAVTNHADSIFDRRIVVAVAVLVAVELGMTRLQAEGANFARRQVPGTRAVATHMSRNAAIEAHLLNGTISKAVIRSSAEGTRFGFGRILAIGFHVSNLAAAEALGGNVPFPKAQRTLATHAGSAAARRCRCGQGQSQRPAFQFH